MFFGKADNSLDALFDWQVVHSGGSLPIKIIISFNKGTGVGDLLRLVFICVEGSMRRAHSEEWFSLYAEELNSTLERLGVQREGKARSLELIRQIAEHHCGYEICFQIFLLTNLLGVEKNTGKRQKLIQRIAELFQDYRNQLFSK